MTKESLLERKHILVRNAIYDAAIEVFASKGYDETTVEEVAQAAGVSRRTFFRYFAAKDDLLAQNMVQYSDALTAALKACPASLPPIGAVRATVRTVLGQIVKLSQTRRVLEIEERSASARKAHTSRMREVEDAVAIGFAARFHSKSSYDAKPRILASLTLSIMNAVMTSWYRGESRDLTEAANQVFATFDQLFRRV